MKKLFMMLAAVLCCVLFSTSCDKNPSVSDFAAYTVNPSGTFGNTNCLSICEEMRAALESGMPLDEHRIGKRNDEKAISICDAVYKNATATGHFSIVLEVTPFGNGMNNTTSLLKTYEF